MRIWCQERLKFKLIEKVSTCPASSLVFVPHEIEELSLTPLEVSNDLVKGKLQVEKAKYNQTDAML